MKKLFYSYCAMVIIMSFIAGYMIGYHWYLFGGFLGLISVCAVLNLIDIEKNNKC